MALTRKKTAGIVVASAVAALLALGGTFAWQSINQTALNELSGKANPGGRLHDDFNGTNKDVYVENFTDLANEGQNIYARVRLDEYMEIGKGEDARPLVDDAKRDDKGTWTTRLHDSLYPEGAPNPFAEFWTWTMGGAEGGDGSTVYMPTFNKDKDSLVADVRGTQAAGFADYAKYEEGAQLAGKAIYDADEDDIDQVNGLFDDASLEAFAGAGNIALKDETHTAAVSLGAQVVTMDVWQAGSPEWQKNFTGWVWDVDGWAYWSQPIAPSTATGKLLDGIERVANSYVGDDWYYGINVVAQFVTYDDIGIADDTGFYDPDAGVAPSESALALLASIGVDVGTAVDGSNLREALAGKGVFNLGGKAVPLTVLDGLKTDGGSATYGLVMHEGGSLSNGAITSSLPEGESAYATLFVNCEENWPNNGDGSAETMLNSLTVSTGTDKFAIYVQPIDDDVTMNRVIVSNTSGAAILAEHGTGKLVLNDCVATAADNNPSDWLNTAVAAGVGANVEVNGGSYAGKYAAYVYSSGGTITINGGTFMGALKADAGSIVVKGGTFSADPSAFVAEGYKAVPNAEGNAWTVVEDAAVDAAAVEGDVSA